MTAVAINSVEAFGQLDVGAVVSVGGMGNVWEKRAEGWVRDGITLAEHHFAGDVLRGRVTVGIAPEAGQVLPHRDNNAYTYVLLRQHARRPNEWHSALMHRGQFQRLTQITPESLGSALTDRPVWADPVYEMGLRLHDMSVDRDAIITREQEKDARIAVIEGQQSVALTEFRTAMGTLLHSLISDPIQEETILAALRQHGLPLPTASVKVTIAATGQAATAVPEDKMVADLIPGADKVSIPSRVYVRWEKTLTTTIDVEQGTCACSQVRRARVRELLVEAGISRAMHSDLAWTSTCENGHDGHSLDF